MMSALRKLLADQRGNSFVEMALITPVLGALLIGTVDISRAYSARVELEQAAQRTVENVQSEIYDPSDNTTLQADAETAAGTGSSATVTDWLQCGTSTTHLDYNSACADGVATARYFQVSITKNYTPLFSYSMFGNNKNADGTITLRGTAGVRTE